MTLTVPYEELEGSPSFRFAGTKSSAKRIIRVAWSDWMQAVGEIYGTYKNIGGVPYYSPPEVFPGMPWLVAQELEMDPFDPQSPDGNGAPNTYTFGGAKITVNYSPIEDEAGDSGGGNGPEKPEVDNGTYLSYSSEIGAEMLSIPGRTCKWLGLTGADAKMADDQPVGIKIPTEQFTLSWTRVPRPPFSVIRAKRGMVNDGPFMGFAHQNVLFLGAKIARDFQIIDTGLYRVDYMFAVKSSPATAPANPDNRYGWNRFYSRKADTDGEHWLIAADDDGNELYADTTFNDLFVQES